MKIILGVFFKGFDVRRSPHYLSLHHVILDQQLDAVHFAQHFTLSHSTNKKIIKLILSNMQKMKS